MELHRSDVNVESFIDSVASIFHTPARGKDITIKMDLGDPSVPDTQGVSTTDMFSVDKFKMSQVLRNLMSNALKFTPEGGTITIRACFIPDESAAMDSATQSSNRPLAKADITTSSSLWSLLSLRHKPQSRGQSAQSTALSKAVIVDVEEGNEGEGTSGQQLAHTPAQPGMLRISVVDSGAGISPENQKRLFNEIIQFNPEILQGGGGSGFGRPNTNPFNPEPP